MHLPHHRRSRSLGDHLFRGLANAFAMGIALEAVILATASGGGPPAESGQSAWARVDQPSGPEARLMQEHNCSSTGYDDSATPQSAILRSPAGRLRIVSFEEGWSVYTQRGPTTLVAVCLDPLTSGAAR
jgi:hypothetical protein